MTDVAKLVREAREWASFISGPFMGGKDDAKYIERLCDALEEREREVERLREHYHVEDNWCMQCGGLNDPTEAASEAGREERD